MPTMEQIRQLVKRCDSTEKLTEGAEWTDKKVNGWDPYYLELIGCWFLLRSMEIDGKGEVNGQTDNSGSV